MSEMKLIDWLTLWCQGLDVPLTVFEDKRVQWEMAQNPVDPHGLQQAVKRAAYNGLISREAINALEQPEYILEFVQLVRQNS
jgi:hypothetical protein